MNDVLRIRIDMRPVIIVLLDFLCRRHQLTYVDGRGMGEILQVVGQVLQLVSQVSRLAHGLLIEMPDLLIFLMLSLSLFLFLLFLLG